MNTELSNHLSNSLYDMVDVALEMRGHEPGSVDSVTYPRVILTEIEYALRGLRHDDVDNLNKKELVKEVGKKLRKKYIDRYSTLDIHFQSLGQELIQDGVLSQEQMGYIGKRRIGYGRKIDLLLAIERIVLDKETLQPGIEQ